jgi:hypothetical protein
VYHNYKLGDSSQLSSFTGYAESPSELGLVSALDTRLRGYDINLYLSDINSLYVIPTQVGIQKNGKARLYTIPSNLGVLASYVFK